VLQQLDSNAVATVLEAIADVQLRLDTQGYCVDASITNPELPDLLRLPWRGNNWLDFCASHHRERAQAAFNKALKYPGQPVRVDLEHVWNEVSGVYPMRYRLVASPSADVVIAIGEDMRAFSDLRQQLVNAQQAMEQDYWALRQVETRYRRLIELTSDAVLMVDAHTQRVLEANTKAVELLTEGPAGLVGRALPVIAPEFQRLLDTARDNNTTANGLVPSPDGQPGLDTTVMFMRQGGDQRYLIRMSDAGNRAFSSDACLTEAFRTAPDAIVQIDTSGQIISCNDIFLSWLSLDNEDQVIGRNLDNWLGRSTVDVSVLLNNLRDQKMVKLYAALLHNGLGSHADVEISGVTIERGEHPRHALFIRDISRRMTSDHPLTEHLPRSIEQVTERVGRLPLKELVRESTDIIEALCIEAALKLTRDNRASAAEMLGLSRQSLYTKLRRYGIGDGAED